MTDPRYPIGPFRRPATIGPAELAAALIDIEQLPAALGAAVGSLPPERLDRPYREGGWTVRQLVHHVADSHLNAYLRHKLAVAEDEPKIRPYDEKVWAELPEARAADVALSLDLLRGLHGRWVAFLRASPPEAFERRFLHPERPDRPWTLGESVCMYGWHGRHHTAHVRAAAELQGA